MQTRIKNIVIRDRFRKEMRNIEELAESIKQNGQLQPIVIDSNYRLIFGERRVRACEMLGYETIEAIIMNLDDKLKAERDENECRENFTPSERLAIANAMKEREQENAKQRRAAHQFGTCGAGQMATTESKGRAREKIAEKAGFGSSTTMRRVEKVVDDGVPELVEAMDTQILPIGTAYKIAMKPPEEQREAVADLKSGKPKAKQKTNKTKADPSRLYAEGSPLSAKSAYRRIEKEIELMGKDDPNTVSVIRKIIDICQTKLTRLTGETT